MSLIKDLGGYEKARDQFDKTPPVLWGYKFALQAELLEYRRANSVYEVGDAIVRRWNNRVYWIITDICNGSEFMISENKNAKFNDCEVCDMPCNFTHATEAEIKQGYREWT